MATCVEVYLRAAVHGVILNMYVPASLKNRFIEALQRGTFSEGSCPIAFEMSVQPQWFTGDSADHVRVPVTAINLIDSE